VKKIKNIQKTINKLRKEKPHINIMMKGPSKRQVIILMNDNNTLKFMIFSSAYIANINRTLKNIKSNIVADFACANHHRLIITTNKVALSFNLCTIKNYIKNIDNIELNGIMTSYLSQLKLYLKSIPYLIENTNTLINSSIVEFIIKNTYILNNILLASKPWVVKASPKSDIAVIWVDIWDVQSSSKAKCLINRCFNIGNFIATI